MNTAAKKKKGFTDIHPTLVKLREYIRHQEIPLRQVSDDLHQYYLTTDKTPDNLYQRIHKLMSADLKEPTPEEVKAVTRWIHVNENSHLYGAILHSIPTLRRKINQLERYLDSSYVNKIEAKKIIRALRQLEPLSTEAIQ